MKYLQFSTPLKATGGWITSEAVAYITGYQINESKIFGSTTSTKNVSVQVSYYKSLADKLAGELPFQPVSDITSPLGMGVYLSDISGTITDAKVLSLVLAHYIDKGLQVSQGEDTPEASSAE